MNPLYRQFSTLSDAEAYCDSLLAQQPLPGGVTNAWSAPVAMIDGTYTVIVPNNFTDALAVTWQSGWEPVGYDQ